MSATDAYKRKISVKINERRYTLEVPARMTLLELLKDRIVLTGTKEGCGAGECGACTVILEGRAVNACLVLAAQVDGMSIQTIEGEALDGKLSELQKAFITHGALQCGFCTPGMIMSARELLDRNPAPTRDEIIEAIAGNLCRCTGYEPIIEAIEAVAKATGGNQGAKS